MSLISLHNRAIDAIKPDPLSLPNVEYNYHLLPEPFPNIDEFDLPKIRVLGIKSSIDVLANMFECMDYKFNLLQFWFLDIIADCLWKLQDEFFFPDDYQKIILKWVLYAFDLIRDSKLRITRKKLFNVFHEMIGLAKEKIELGCPLPPTPADLEENIKNCISLSTYVSTDPSYSTIASPTSTNEDDNYLVIEDKEKLKNLEEEDEEEVDTFNYLKLPKNICSWDQDFLKEEPQDYENELDGISPTDDIQFLEKFRRIFKPNNKIPERFLRLPNQTVTSEVFGNTEYLLKCSIINYPKINVESYGESSLEIEEESLNGEADILDQYKMTNENYLNQRKTIFKNKMVLLAIQAIFFEYFSETFQFLIIKLAIRRPMSTEGVPINSIWNIPKTVKADVKKKIVKKYYKFKNKKPPKEKKPKKQKLSKKERKEMKKLKKLEQKMAKELAKLEAKKKLLLPLKEAITKEFVKDIFIKLDSQPPEEQNAQY